MFYGRYEHVVDAKGRMRIPSQFKKELADGCVFFAPTNEVVSIYTKEGIQKKLDFAKNLSPFNKAEIRAAKKVFGSIYDKTEDGQGRILIPTEVRNKLKKIECYDKDGNKYYTEVSIKDIISIGMGDHIDITTKQACDGKNDDATEDDDLDMLDMLYKKSNEI